MIILRGVTPNAEDNLKIITNQVILKKEDKLLFKLRV